MMAFDGRFHNIELTIHASALHKLKTWTYTVLTCFTKIIAEQPFLTQYEQTNDTTIIMKINMLSSTGDSYLWILNLVLDIWVIIIAFSSLWRESFFLDFLLVCITQHCIFKPCSGWSGRRAQQQKSHVCASGSEEHIANCIMGSMPGPWRTLIQANFWRTNAFPMDFV